MKKLLIILILSIFFNTNILAVTLEEALLEAYNNNLELNAERKNIEVSKEILKISKSDFFPTLTITGSKNFENTNKLTNQSGGDASIDDVDTFSQSVKIEQTLYDGLGRNAKLEKNELGLNLAEAKLVKTEQEILFKAIEAYTGLIVTKEKFEINKKNVSLLERQYQIDNARLERGQITLSDLAQSKSSLAGAQAKFIEAQNNTIISKLVYENIIGLIKNDEKLKKVYNLNSALPVSLNKAIEISKKNSPELIIAKIEYGQSELDVKIARSDLLPSASLSLERSYSENFSATYDEREKDTLQAIVSWPFQFGGKNRSEVNKNLSVKGRKRLLLDSVQKTNTQIVTSAWSTFLSSESFLKAIQVQVKAAEIANEGITFEYENGLERSIFDVIQSNSFLLNARTSLADSERNYVLAQYNLLKSIGFLTSDYLKIK
jgi:outer membrane protein